MLEELRSWSASELNERKPSVSAVKPVKVRRADPSSPPETDLLAVEEPLEIRLVSWSDKGVREQTVSITMRTPGREAELAAGFLFGEGIIRQRSDIDRIDKGSASLNKGGCNVVRVFLTPDGQLSTEQLNRHFYMTSSCGVCGKASIEALAIRNIPSVAGSDLRLSKRSIGRLSSRLRSSQSIFELTGGLHAAGLFDCRGELIHIQEDVGRHNAVDKVIGEEFMAGNIPLSNRILMVSGRTSFEILQKAVMAGIPIVAAVGAPSSLAVELSLRFDVTLLGFCRGGGFNVYSGEQRLAC